MIKILLRWKEHVKSYTPVLVKHNIMLIKYEELLTNYPSVVSRMIQYMGLEIPEKDFHEVLRDCSFGYMNKQSPGHVAKGSMGQWRSFMDKRLISEVSELAREEFKYFQYPLH